MTNDKILEKLKVVEEDLKTLREAGNNTKKIEVLIEFREYLLHELKVQSK